MEASRAESISSRPAVYTDETRRGGLFARLRLPQLRMPSLSAPAVPTWLIALVAFVLAVAIVAGPARTYYLAWRESGVLQAELNALTSQNDELNHQIERLQTLEGIEDQARSRGYVYPDEEALVVTDLKEEEVADPALVDAALQEYEKSLPWYVGILDAIFGYKGE